MKPHAGRRMQRLFNSGGNYTNGTNAGVFYSNGNNNSRSNTNTNIGFRAALPTKGPMHGGHGCRASFRGKRIRPPNLSTFQEAARLKSKTAAVNRPAIPEGSASPAPA